MGLECLRQLELPTPSQQLRRDLVPEEIEALIRQVQSIEQQLNRQAHRSPAVHLPVNHPRSWCSHSGSCGGP
jgi:hypothetical protein